MEEALLTWGLACIATIVAFTFVGLVFWKNPRTVVWFALLLCAMTLVILGGVSVYYLHG